VRFLVLLTLTQSLLNEIEAHGVASYPYEGCGLLLGESTGEQNTVQAIFPVENRWEVEDEKRERFYIAAEDMLRAEMAAMAAGQEVIGVFHSHPDHEPVASPRDLAWAAWVGYSYLITAVRQARPGESRSWQLRPDRTGFDEEEIVVQ
jgi:proteasome lid subunit RPN8/RPN11